LLGELGESLCAGADVEGVEEGGSNGAAPTAVPSLTWGRGLPPSSVERTLGGGEGDGDGEAATRAAAADGSGDGAAAAADVHTCSGVSMNDANPSGSVTVAAVG